MGYRRISVEVSEGLGVVTLSRPGKRNALDRHMLDELGSAVEDLATARVVVLRGEGPSFCSGLDLSEYADPASFEREQIAESVALGRRASDALQACAAITIAAVHGHCVGGGMVLAASCDLRIAATGTTFRLPEVGLGIPLVWGGVPVLLRSMPSAVAKDLAFTCRPFEAEEALRVGFLSRIVPEDDLTAEVDRLTKRLLGLPPTALAVAKAQFAAVEQRGEELDEAEAVLAALRGDAP